MNDIWAQRFATRYFERDSVGGIMLCGINWGDGGTAGDISGLRQEQSFFSDTKTQNARYPYQTRIREWFRILGYPLSEHTAGPLERMISQTNWVGCGSRHADAIYTRKHLVACAEEEFFPVLRAARPRLLVFFGVQHLPAAFADRALLRKEEDLLGKLTAPCESHWLQRNSGSTRFRATTMRFERCAVLGLPHPTPKARALGNEDVKKLRALFADAMAFCGVTSS